MTELTDNLVSPRSELYTKLQDFDITKINLDGLEAKRLQRDLFTIHKIIF